MNTSHSLHSNYFHESPRLCIIIDFEKSKGDSMKLKCFITISIAVLSSGCSLLEDNSGDSKSIFDLISSDKEQAKKNEVFDEFQTKINLLSYENERLKRSIERKKRIRLRNNKITNERKIIFPHEKNEYSDALKGVDALLAKATDLKSKISKIDNSKSEITQEIKKEFSQKEIYYVAYSFEEYEQQVKMWSLLEEGEVSDKFKGKFDKNYYIYLGAYHKKNIALHRVDKISNMFGSEPKIITQKI